MLKSTLQQYKIISYCKYNELYSKTPPHAHPRSEVTSRHTVRSRLSASKPPGHAVRFRLSATAVPPVPLPNPCALPPLPVPPPDPCLLPNSATAALPPFRPIPAYRPVVPHHSAARFRHIATAFSRIHKTAGFLARLCSFRARRGGFSDFRARFSCFLSRRGGFSGVRARFSCFLSRRGGFSDFWARFSCFLSRRGGFSDFRAQFCGFLSRRGGEFSGLRARCADLEAAGASLAVYSKKACTWGCRLFLWSE